MAKAYKDVEGEKVMEKGVEEMKNATQGAAASAQRQFRRMQRNPLDPLDLFGGPMARMMDQNWSMFQKMMHLMREESLHFVNRRLEQTSHALESSRDCEGLTDLIAIQQEWMVSFARDYAEQTKRMAEVMRELAEDGTSQFTQAASEVGERSRSAAAEQSRRAA